MWAPVDRRTVVQCYRANDLAPLEIYPTQKKTKKVQKEVQRKSASISPAVYDIASVHTNPIEPFENAADRSKQQRTSSMKKKKKKVIFRVCECNDDEKHKKHPSKYRAETWDSITRIYGNADTTEVWAKPENQVSTLEPDVYSRYPIMETNDKYKHKVNGSKKHKRKPKTHKKRGQHFKNNFITEDIDQQSYPNSGKPVPLDTPVISLFRKEHAINRQSERGTIEKSKSRNKSKSKEANYKDLTFITASKNNCPEGICAEEAMKNKKFLCKCINVKKEPDLKLNMKECTDATCRLARDSLSRNSIVKMKDKFLCICQKYSHKIINLKPHDRDIENRDRILTKTKLSKQEKNKNNIVIKKEHQSEQTGEPFFEIQVNPRDMCVLNPIEIKENIIKYGRTEKNEPKCICPSRGRLRAGEVCKSGACKKAYKNKQINFNCWCEKKIAECGDATCDIKGIGHIRKKKNRGKHIRNQTVNKPLLEVQLDMDKMCVVNPKEIQEKIISNISVDEICSSGVCREAALEHKIPYFCKCISKKINSEITECTEDTCTDTTQKKKSKFSLFCSRICSKSENWSHGINRNKSQRRIKRRSFYEIGGNKLCKGRLCTKSDHLRKNNGLNSNNVDISHLPTCDCQECKNPLKPTTLKPKEKPEFRQEKPHVTNEVVTIPKLNVTNPVVDNHIPKRNLNLHNLAIQSPRLRELNFHNSKNVKRAEISNDLTFKTKDVMCYCAHACECDMDKSDEVNTNLKDTRYKEKQARRKLARRKRNKKKDDRDFYRAMKRRAKLDKKLEKKAAKERLKEIKMMQKKMNEEPLEINFCTALTIGILKIGVKTIVCLFTIIISLIKNPKKCYWYVRDRIRDPEGTWTKIKKWFIDALAIKKLQISETVRGSDTLTILADHFQDTPFYQSFASKGKSKKEQMEFEQKSKARKRRIRKREQQAIFSCRHMLLTTLRQTPCLWVYHICPNFYPQCLGLLAFMRSFSRILLFLVAFACWTPCILSFELCRAFLCCFMCTG